MRRLRIAFVLASLVLCADMSAQSDGKLLGITEQSLPYYPYTRITETTYKYNPNGAFVGFTRILRQNGKEQSVTYHEIFSSGNYINRFDDVFVDDVLVNAYLTRCSKGSGHSYLTIEVTNGNDSTDYSYTSYEYKRAGYQWQLYKANVTTFAPLYSGAYKVTLEWDDGDVKSISYYDVNVTGEHLFLREEFTYGTETVGSDIVKAILIPLRFTYFPSRTVSNHFLPTGWYGTLPVHLPESSKMTFYDDERAWLNFGLTMTKWRYERDEQGRLSKIITEVDNPDDESPFRDASQTLLHWDAPSAIKPAKSSSTTFADALFDLQGRRVEGQPRRGLYIQQGRKRVVR